MVLNFVRKRLRRIRRYKEEPLFVEIKNILPRGKIFYLERSRGKREREREKKKSEKECNFACLLKVKRYVCVGSTQLHLDVDREMSRLTSASMFSMSPMSSRHREVRVVVVVVVVVVDLVVGHSRIPSACRNDLLCPMMLSIKAT